MTNKYIFAFLLLAAVVPLRAQERMVFTPQWTPQAQFAGYYGQYASGILTAASGMLTMERCACA